VKRRTSWREQAATGRNKYKGCIKGIEKLTENFEHMDLSIVFSKGGLNEA
jgi:hypothetical protein